ncbi:MAG: sulfatase-like hydrolase/transferase [Bacteroidales bacterium]|nr:sulfatase-like hydrolase/transferase [Bacteroidales bacterium]
MTIRKNIIVTFLATTMAFSAILSCTPKEGSLIKRPLNIIVMVSEGHSREAIGAYGDSDSFISTPGLDSLASEGNLFLSYRITGWESLDMIEDSLPAKLSEKGYEMAFFGTWDNEGSPSGYGKSFILQGEGSYYNPMLIDNGMLLCREGYVSSILTDEAVDWIGGLGGGDPFYMVLHHFAPCGTWMPDTRDLGMYGDVDLPPLEKSDSLVVDFASRLNPIYHLKMADRGGKIHTPSESRLETMGRDLYRRDLRPYDPIVPGRMTPGQQKDWDAHYDPIISAFRKSNPRGNSLIEWKFSRFEEDYLETANSLDRSVSQLTSFLKEKGLWDNTVLVYTSSGSLGRDDSSPLPLIIHMPGKGPDDGRFIYSRGEIEKDVTDLDLVRSIMEFSCLTPSEEAEGESFLPLLIRRNPDKEGKTDLWSRVKGLFGLNY